jgi:hypothetical protein
MQYQETSRYSVTVHSVTALGVEAQLQFFLTQALDGD